MAKLFGFLWTSIADSLDYFTSARQIWAIRSVNVHKAWVCEGCSTTVSCISAYFFPHVSPPRSPFLNPVYYDVLGVFSLHRFSPYFVIFLLISIYVKCSDAKIPTACPDNFIARDVLYM